VLTGVLGFAWLVAWLVIYERPRSASAPEDAGGAPFICSDPNPPGDADCRGSA